MSLLYAYLRLTRPLNGSIAFISVILGAIFASGGVRPIVKVAIVATSAFLLLSAGNALNDFWDDEIDKINKPKRPIPSGQIKRRSALIFAVILFIIGAGLGLFVNWVAFTVAISVTALLVLYTVNLRKFLLLGNITIGLLTGLTFISGGIAVGTIGGAIIPAMFAFLFTTGREIIKDIQDIRGDQAGGMISLPIKWGKRKAMYTSLVFLFLVIIISPFPYVLGIYSIGYLVCVVLGVDMVLVYCIFLLLRKDEEQNAAKVANLMKFDIFIGLSAMYLGTLGA